MKSRFYLLQVTNTSGGKSSKSVSYILDILNFISKGNFSN